MLDIMSESNYQDEEIRKNIEEKLCKAGKSSDWKSKGKWDASRVGKPGFKPQDSKKSPNLPVLPPSLATLANPYATFQNFANFSHFSNFVKNVNVNSGLTLPQSGLKNVGLSVKDSSQSATENSQRLTTNIQPLYIKSKLEEDEVDHYFNAALNLSKSVEKEEKTVNATKNCLSSDDIKQFTDDLKKNKEQIQRSRDKITSTKMELSITTSQKDKKPRETSPEIKFDYDLTNMPSFLNANSYSNYFYQTNNSSKATKNKTMNEPQSFNV